MKSKKAKEIAIIEDTTIEALESTLKKIINNKQALKKCAVSLLKIDKLDKVKYYQSELSS